MEKQCESGEMCPEEVNWTALGTGPAFSLLATHWSSDIFIVLSSVLKIENPCSEYLLTPFIARQPHRNALTRKDVGTTLM